MTNGWLSTPVQHLLLVELRQTMGYALVFITLFSNLGGQSSEITTSLISVVCTQGSLIVSLMNDEFPAHRSRLERVIYEVIHNLVFPTLFSGIVYPLSGYHQTFSKFFVFLLVVCQLRACATAMVDTIRAICAFAGVRPFIFVFVGIELLRAASLSGVSFGMMASWFGWLVIVDHFKSGLKALVLNELQGQRLMCGSISDRDCASSSAQLIDELHRWYPDEWHASLWDNLMILSASVIVFRVANYRIRRWITH